MWLDVTGQSRYGNSNIMVMQNEHHHRHVKSYVRREGRITPRQQEALIRLWGRYGCEIKDGVLDQAAVFGRMVPLTVEIGFGMGQSLIEMAQAAPERDFIGIEVHRPGVGALLAELDKLQIENVRVYSDDAVLVLDQCIANNSADAVQLFFPDPWPKKRHHKRRLVQPEFIEVIAAKLKMAGRFHLATDWEDYAEHMMQVLSECSDFTNPYGAGCYAPRLDRPQTKFEKRGSKLGHKIWDLVFLKIGLE